MGVGVTSLEGQENRKKGAKEGGREEGRKGGKEGWVLSTYLLVLALLVLHDHVA